MSEQILTFALITAQLLLALALCLAAWRILIGPRAQDRVLGLDTLYVNAMLLIVTTGIREGTPFLFEAALIIGTLGFVTSVTAAKFLMRGEVIE